MNIQNIPYKGVDYTKENYDESFPLLGCLHDQWLLWGVAGKGRAGAAGKRFRKTKRARHAKRRWVAEITSEILENKK